MKSLKSLLLFLIVCIFISGCSSTEVKKPQEVQRFLMKLKSYQCEVVLAVTNNKSTNVYKARHIYKGINKYRIEMMEPNELKGQTTIYNGEKTYIYHPQINTYMLSNNFESSLEYSSFLGSFIEHFKDKGGARFKIESLKDTECYVLEIPLDEKNPYRVMEKIWIDAKRIIPIKAEILDKNNNLNAQILYENFEINPDIDDSLFEIPKK